jgi:carotenoid cleavage dioxygenase-like enzyme
VMVYVYDGKTDRSDLAVIDARDFTGAPVATIHLPRRVPAGLHGNWMES